MKSPKELDDYTKEFYRHLQECSAGADAVIGELVRKMIDVHLGDDAKMLVLGATWCHHYNGTAKAGNFALYYTDDCRIVRPDCRDSLANFCSTLNATAGYRSFRFRGSDGHWYVNLNPDYVRSNDNKDEIGKWILGAIADGES